MLRFCFIFTLALMMVSCTDQPNHVENKSEPRAIYQISYQHSGLGKDSIVLLSDDDKSEFYDWIKIFRGQQLIFEHREKYLEIVGSPQRVFFEHPAQTPNEYFYILRMFEGQSPNSFLIIKTSKDKTIIFGKTETNSADIFGDVDYDGKFEIGGWTDFCQEDELKKCPNMDLYRIFEIDDNFPTDSTLTRIFKQLIKKS